MSQMFSKIYFELFRKLCRVCIHEEHTVDERPKQQTGLVGENTRVFNLNEMNFKKKHTPSRENAHTLTLTLALTMITSVMLIFWDALRGPIQQCAFYQGCVRFFIKFIS